MPPFRSGICAPRHLDAVLREAELGKHTLGSLAQDFVALAPHPSMRLLCHQALGYLSAVED